MISLEGQIQGRIDWNHCQVIHFCCRETQTEIVLNFSKVWQCFSRKHDLHKYFRDQQRMHLRIDIDYLSWHQKFACHPPRSILTPAVCCTTSVCAPNFGFHLDTATSANATTTFTCCSSSLSISTVQGWNSCGLWNPLGAAAHLLRIHQALRYPPSHMLSNTKLPRFTGIWLA